MPAYPRHYELTSPCDSPGTDISNSILDSPKYNSSPLDLSFSSHDSSPSPLDLRVAAIDLSVSPTSSPPRFRRTYAFQRYLSRSPSSSSYTDSSPTYCSTCVDSSSIQSLPTYSPKTVNAAYCPLSPLSTSSVYGRRRFYDDQDNLCDNIPSPYFSSECLSSPPRNLYRRVSSNYSTEYKSTMLDYSPLSPQTTYPMYCDSSPEYSFSKRFEEKTKSPTYVHSPLSSSSYYGFSPQYLSSSPSDYSPPPYRYALDDLSKSTTSSQNINYRSSSQYPQLSVDRRYRSASPTYYPLSPQDTPSSPRYYHLSPLRVRRRNIEDDIPCVCCSPPPSQY